MNFQALTQAARNVFREWFTAIRSHGPLLKHSYFVLAFVMQKRGMTFLLPSVFIIAPLGAVMALCDFADHYPARSGDGYQIACCLATGVVIAGVILHSFLWMFSIDNAIELRRHETYPEIR